MQQTNLFWLIQLCCLSMFGAITPAIAEPDLIDPLQAGPNHTQIRTTESVQIIAAIDTPAFVDTREIKTCSQHSISGALCMHASQFMYPEGAIASFRDINWLVGTFDLRESAPTVVFGDVESDNFFIAGLLFLLGQKNVIIWTSTVSSLLEQSQPGRGATRGVLRRHYYHAPMRDKFIALDNDVREFFRRDGVLSVAETATLPGSKRDSPTFIYEDQDGTRLVLAQSPRAAMNQFVSVLLDTASNQEPGAVVVHLDGLGERRPQFFGAPDKPSQFWKIGILVLSVCIIPLVIVYRPRLRKFTLK